MVATDIREQRPCIQLWPAAGSDLGSVEEACGRPSSLRIVWACVRYAASVRYQRVTLDDLSAAANVSERRVRDAFSDCHGMSPTAFLRVAALLEVRRALLATPRARRVGPQGAPRSWTATRGDHPRSLACH